MTESLIPAPLASLEGQTPLAPEWFSAALARSPERSWHDVNGARIETLTWGERGKPGLLFLHGNKAHADWWSFIAPHFADHYRVAAFSWSGMGASDWRETYSLDGYAEEADAIAQAAGLFDNERKPVFIAHSFGGFVAARYAAQHGSKLGGIVTVDMPLHKRDKDKPHSDSEQREALSPRPHRVYPTLAAALARFRFAPPQPCDNTYIADHIARTSLKQAPLEDGTGDGWTWRFDPALWRHLRIANPWADVAASQCKVAVMWGGDSSLIQDELLQLTRNRVSAHMPFIEIPAARHHVMVDQPLALVAGLHGLLSAWPHRLLTPHA